MSNLTCPGCGSVYPLSAVSRFDVFKCAVCHETIVVPIAGPAPSRAAPARAMRDVPPPAAAPPLRTAATPPRTNAPSRRTEHAPPSDAAPKHRVDWGIVVAAVAVCAAVAVGAVLLRGENAAPRQDTSALAPKSEAAPPASASSAPRADPTKDPDAWRALSAAERADRTVKYFAALDRRNSGALVKAYEFFKARGETDAVRRVADMEIAQDPTTEWAHAARGDVDAGSRIDRCLAECARAEEIDSPGVRRLAALQKDRRPASGAWWAGEALAKDVDAAIAQVRAEEKALASPPEWAAAKWRSYRAAAVSTKGRPALDAVAGPYLVFVEMNAPAGTPVDGVSADEQARAKRVLAATESVLEACYDGFFAQFGDGLGLRRRDATSVDVDTVLKVDVLAASADMDALVKRLGAPPPIGGRALYEDDEPRFVVALASDDAAPHDADDALCRAAVRQILHAATWDLSRDARGAGPSWAECRTRPAWIDAGLAAFFASHERQGTKFAWMRPRDDAMRTIWATTAALKKKRWADWSLDEILAAADDAEVFDQAVRRVSPKTVNRPTAEQLVEMRLAVGAMVPLFEAKAWSLVRFLWDQCDASGKPSRRDAFLRFVKNGLNATGDADGGTASRKRALGAGAFRKAMGLAAEDAYRAFEKEWLAWEAALLERSRRPEWATARDRVLETLGAK